jgi:CcmD family protein
MEPIYTVLIIILIIWFGIFGYMLYLDKEIKKLSQRFEKLKKEGNS